MNESNINIIVYNIITAEIIYSLGNFYDCLTWNDLIYKIRSSLEDNHKNGFNVSIDLVKYNTDIILKSTNYIIDDIDNNYNIQAIIQPLRNNDIEDVIKMLDLYTNCPNKFMILIKSNLKNKIFMQYLVNYLIDSSCEQRCFICNQYLIEPFIINQSDFYIVIIKNLVKYFEDYDKITNSSLILVTLCYIKCGDMLLNLNNYFTINCEIDKNLYNIYAFIGSLYNIKIFTEVEILGTNFIDRFINHFNIIINYFENNPKNIIINSLNLLIQSNFIFLINGFDTLINISKINQIFITNISNIYYLYEKLLNFETKKLFDLIKIKYNI